MHFYRTEQLLVALEHRLREAKNVDIAVAWAWSCSALELLDEAASRGVKIRAIVILVANSGTGASRARCVTLTHG
jgi:hypothetical protein